MFLPFSFFAFQDMPCLPEQRAYILGDSLVSFQNDPQYSVNGRLGSTGQNAIDIGVEKAIVTNLAIPGASATGGGLSDLVGQINQLEVILAGQQFQRKDFAIVSFGTNDFRAGKTVSETVSALAAGFDRLETLGAKRIVVLASANAIGIPTGTHQEFVRQIVTEAVRLSIRAPQTTVIDVPSLIDRLPNGGLMSDRVHWSDDAQKIVGEKLNDVLLQLDLQSDRGLRDAI